MKVEVDVLGSLSLIVRTAPVDVKQHRTITHIERLRSRVKVEVDVLDLSLIHISEPTRRA